MAYARRAPGAQAADEKPRPSFRPGCLLNDMADSEKQPPRIDNPEDWESVAMLACEMSLEVPIPGFTVRDLLKLAPGDVIDTHWAQTSDVPLRINGVLLSWTEFELIGNRLAVRLTELE